MVSGSYVLEPLSATRANWGSKVYGPWKVASAREVTLMGDCRLTQVPGSPPLRDSWSRVPGKTPPTTTRAVLTLSIANGKYLTKGTVRTLGQLPAAPPLVERCRLPTVVVSDVFGGTFWRSRLVTR